MLDTAAVSVSMCEKSCNKVTIKEECQVVKYSGLGAFSSAVHDFHCFSFLHTVLSVLKLPIYIKIQVKQGADLKHLLSDRSASTFQTHL